MNVLDVRRPMNSLGLLEHKLVGQEPPLATTTVCISLSGDSSCVPMKTGLAVDTRLVPLTISGGLNKLDF